MIDYAAEPLVLPLESDTTLAQVGGKGASLARLAAAGLPVPAGFDITTAAYRRFVAEHGVQEQILAIVGSVDTADPARLEAAAQQIGVLFGAHPLPAEIATAIDEAYAELGGGPVAVRSSATAEDLPDMSFAGQQDSFLNVQGAAQVRDAVRRCWASLWTARAIGYRARNGIEPADVSLAVVVQTLVPADAAGILFTADPVTGDRDRLVINAAWGLGEAVVGGQVTPDTFVVRKHDGALVAQEIGVKTVMTVRTTGGTREEPVPAARQQAPVLSAAQAAELARIGARIEELYGVPMDVEWALHDGTFAIVQARPITTLQAVAPAEVWNDSLRGDYLWTNANVGEAVPDVMTPAAWSLIKVFLETTIPVPAVDGHPMSGNIGGRLYMNLSALATLGKLFGMSKQRFAEANEQVFGRVPAGVELPLVPASRLRVIRAILPVAVRMRRRVAANQAVLPGYLAAAPGRCDTLRATIAATSEPAALLRLWAAEVEPLFLEACYMLEAGARRDGNVIVWARRTLRKLVGEAEANALLSGLHGAGGELASLGLLVGLSRLEQGEIDRATFARQYGHRGPHELEISAPRPAEDPAWIDAQLAGLRTAALDVPALLERQAAVQQAAWERLRQRFPRQAAKLRRKIDQAGDAFRFREAARSEVVRVFWVLRAWVQQAGALSGLGDDIFFLRFPEIEALLRGDRSATSLLPARHAAYAHYRALPPYPTLIRGHFEPERWAADPNRRGDVWDASLAKTSAEAVIAGFPGAAGVVEGTVRVLHTAEEGAALQPGEILVTAITNVGWTPLFPRAAAVVTDVGAPLSHAAIVARELGIPAVVGTGSATMRLHTGDRVRVDGGHGTVEVIGAAL